VQSLADGLPRGLLTPIDGDGAINAYCSGCEAYLIENGGNWPEDYDEVLKVTMICVGCLNALSALKWGSVRSGNV